MEDSNHHENVDNGETQSKTVSCQFLSFIKSNVNKYTNIQVNVVFKDLGSREKDVSQQAHVTVD